MNELKARDIGLDYAIIEHGHKDYVGRIGELRENYDGCSICLLESDDVILMTKTLLVIEINFTGRFQSNPV